MSDTAQPEGAGKPILDDEDTVEHAWARIGTRLGLIACGFALGAMWTCGMSNWVALPCGLGAAWLGYRALQAAEERTATRAYAKVAMISGILASAFALLYFVLVGSYFMLVLVSVVLGGM